LPFTENETNTQKVSGVPNKTPFVKDAFHDAVINKTNLEALKQKRSGTKFAPVYHYNIAPGETKSIYLRLSNKIIENPLPVVQQIFLPIAKRRRTLFITQSFQRISPRKWRNVQRQALAGLLWSKQYYHFDVGAMADHQRWDLTGECRQAQWPQS